MKAAFYCSENPENPSHIYGKPFDLCITRFEDSDEVPDLSLYEKYKFKDLGYIFILWKYQDNSMWFYHGLATIQDLKETLGVEQYSKFCQGKREFIQQRRVDNHNT